MIPTPPRLFPSRPIPPPLVSLVLERQRLFAEISVDRSERSQPGSTGLSIIVGSGGEFLNFAGSSEWRMKDARFFFIVRHCRRYP